MSYGFDLVRLSPGLDRDEAFRRRQESSAEDLNAGPINPEKEAVKQQLAAALMARHPTLQLFKPDWEEVARIHSIDVAEAKRRYRELELSEKRYRFQIYLFDDTAGASWSFGGSSEECVDAVRFVWDCLEILEREGRFSIYDPQIRKVLDLRLDFNLVLKSMCGVER